MRDPSRTPFNQFLVGATQPSLPALLGAILVAAGILLLCLLEVNPRTMANPAAQLLVKKPRDQYGHLTLNTLRLHQSPPANLCVVIIGDSMIYQAIPRPKNLEEALESKLHAPVAVRILAAGALTQWEAIALTDSIRDRIQGMVLLEISPFNLSLGGPAQHERIAQPRLALDSPSFREEAQRAGDKPPRQLNNYFLDHYSFFATRVDSPLLLPAWYSRPKRGLRAWTDTQWETAQPRFTAWVKTFARESPHNFEIYARIIQRLEQNPHLAVALLEGAQNPRNQDIAGVTAYAQYHQAVADFAQHSRVPYLDITAAAHLEAGDFADYAHLANSSARTRYVAALVERLAPLISEKRIIQEANP